MLALTEMSIYWVTRLDGIKTFLEALSLFVLVSCCIAIFFVSIFYTEIGRGFKPIFLCILGLLLSFLFGLGWVFTPSTKEMYVIKAIPMIVNNEEVQEIPNKVLELTTEWIEELKPIKNKN